MSSTKEAIKKLRIPSPAQLKFIKSRINLTTTNGKLDVQTASKILSVAKATRKGARFSLDKIFLYHSYCELIQKRALFHIQLNNLSANQYDQLQFDLRSAGFQVSVVRNNLYSAALRDVLYNHKTCKTKPGNIKKLRGMFCGPTAVATFSQPETDTVNILESFSKIVSNHSQTLVSGGWIDGMALTWDEISMIRKTYPGGLNSLHGQLIGLLEGARRGPVDALESTGKRMIMMLEQRTKDLGLGESK